VNEALLDRRPPATWPRQPDVDVDTDQLLLEPGVVAHDLFPQDSPGEQPDQGPLRDAWQLEDLDSRRVLPALCVTKRATRPPPASKSVSQATLY
jgi:hypothetical protein